MTPFQLEGIGAVISIGSLRTGWMKLMWCAGRQMPPSGVERGAPD